MTDAQMKPSQINLPQSATVGTDDIDEAVSTIDGAMADVYTAQSSLDMVKDLEATEDAEGNESPTV
ncbi:MAG: hypothetical protein ABIJ03_03615 [Patescibacteria group bacterium]|nr:hypothetical protein [Patescibacteria group bacterium]